ncbi:MAG: hypothetical protein ACKVPX_00180 [Myxococcaceae bacterium]
MSESIRTNRSSRASDAQKREEVVNRLCEAVHACLTGARNAYGDSGTVISPKTLDIPDSCWDGWDVGEHRHEALRDALARVSTISGWHLAAVKFDNPKQFVLHLSPPQNPSPPPTVMGDYLDDL